MSIEELLKSMSDWNDCFYTANDGLKTVVYDVDFYPDTFVVHYKLVKDDELERQFVINGLTEKAALKKLVYSYTGEGTLYARITNAFFRNGINTIDTLRYCDIDDIAKIRYVGEKSLNLIKEMKDYLEKETA